MSRPRILSATPLLGVAFSLLTPCLSIAQNESTSRQPPTSLLIMPLEARAGSDDASLSIVDPTVFARARSITDPAERSLALQRIGRSAIFSGQLKEAEAALYEAGTAAALVPDRVMRDVRLTSVITGILTLADEQLRFSNEDARPPIKPLDPAAPAEAKPLPEPLPHDVKQYHNAALAEWETAASLALLINNATYRSEALFKVVDGQSFGSQTLVRSAMRPPGTFSGIIPADQPVEPVKPDPRILQSADQLLVESAGHAKQIDRPVWRNKAYRAIAENAAASQQFARGIQIARLIPQPDSRSEALIRLAEAEAIHGQGREATQTFSEAAETVASISAGDLRAIIANVLVDNLVTIGRFDDARACVNLYPYEWQQIDVLGAVAESQGRRGLSKSAYHWIDNDSPPQYRSVLSRRVADGILASVEQNRSRDLSGNKGY